MSRQPRTAPPVFRAALLLSIAAVVAVIVGSLGVLPAAEGKAPRGNCRSASGTLLAQSSLAVAYKIKRRSAGREGFETLLVGCLRATGRRRVLAVSPQWFDHPARAVAVHGSAVGYATREIPALDSDPSITNIEIAYLRQRAGSTAARGGHALRDAPRVESLDITSQGAAAWIECPELGSSGSAEPQPSCTSSLLKDSDKRVMALAPEAPGAFNEPVEVARSRTLDPRSVQIVQRRGTYWVSWTQSGDRRTAPLPPAAPG